jgi:hypothetical protein
VGTRTGKMDLGVGAVGLVCEEWEGGTSRMMIPVPSFSTRVCISHLCREVQSNTTRTAHSRQNIRCSIREREIEPPQAHAKRPSSGQIREQQHRIAGKTKGDELPSFLNTIDIVREPVQCGTRCFGHQKNLTLKAF